MPITIVFDTNAYRELVYGLSPEEAHQKAHDTRLREQRAGFRAAASPYVMFELLAHLADPSDPAYSHCLLAVRAQQVHCTMDLATGQIAMLGDFESHLARALYKTNLPDYDHITGNVALIAQSLLIHPTEEQLSRARPYLIEIRDFVAKSEADFVSDVHTFVVRSLQPNATDWRPLQHDPEFRSAMLAHLRTNDALEQLAHGFVFKTMLQVHGQQIPDPDFAAKVAFVVEHFATPLNLYRSILLRIVETGCDLSRRNRANWLWDIYLSFSAGCHLGGSPVQTITGDRDIAVAAAGSDAGDSVLSLENHLSRLEGILPAIRETPED